MKTVMLIDDDPDMLLIASKILENKGYDVVKVDNGQGAVELARSNPPDVVLCDIAMPTMNGYGVLRELGRDPRTADIPFIFVSGKVEQEDLPRDVDAGANDYLAKPFQASELLQVVEGRLRQREVFQKNFSDGLKGLNRFFDLARGRRILKDKAQKQQMRILKERELIFREGDELSDVFYIIRGKVRTFSVNKDGKELTTGLHGTGDFLGYASMLEDRPEQECAEALEGSKVSLIPKEKLLALIHNDPDVSGCFIKLLARDVESKRSHLLQLAYSSLRQRVARSLLRIQERYAENLEDYLGLPVTRADLASIVGTTTESLIRCLSDLKEEELISVVGRDIRILNKPSLEKLARI